LGVFAEFVLIVVRGAASLIMGLPFLGQAWLIVERDLIMLALS